MSGMPEIEIREGTSHGNGSSTGRYYRIECRNSYVQPMVIGEGRQAFVIDHCWRELPIRRGGVPFGTNIRLKEWDGDAAEHGLVSYVAAEAHRWAFLAYLDAASLTGSMCIETRLVEIELHKEWSAKEMGVSASLKDTIRTKPTFAPRHPPEPAAA